jgi:hypothetical protein
MPKLYLPLTTPLAITTGVNEYRGEAITVEEMALNLLNMQSAIANLSTAGGAPGYEYLSYQLQGYYNNGWDATTQAAIDNLLALGVNAYQISIIDLGTAAEPGTPTNATITVAAVTIQPGVTAPTLSAAAAGATNGTLTVASTSVRPTVTVPVITAVRNGAITVAATSVQPAITVPSMSVSAAGATNGTIAAPTVTVQPGVTVPVITGVRNGTITVAATSVRPAITAAVMSVSGAAAANGTIGVPSTSVQPVVAAPSMSASSPSLPVDTGATGWTSVNLPIVAQATYFQTVIYPITKHLHLREGYITGSFTVSYDYVSDYESVNCLLTLSFNGTTIFTGGDGPFSVYNATPGEGTFEISVMSTNESSDENSIVTGTLSTISIPVSA